MLSSSYLTMKRTTFITCVVYSLLMFQNKYGECVSCGYGSPFSHLNTSALKSDSFEPQERTNASLSSNSISTSNRLDIPKVSELPPSVRTVEDLIALFGSPASLADLSPAGKISAVTLLTSSCNGFTTNAPPTFVIVNLINMLACSHQLFSALPEPVLNAALTTLTVNPCALSNGVSTKVLVQFLNGLLSLDAGVLNGVPRSVLVTALGAVRSTEVLNALPVPATVNLVTVLSLSRPLFNCLPLPALLSLLTYVADKPAREMVGKLPPSTVFGFLDGMLSTLSDSSPFVVNAVPSPVLASVLGPIMTSRMLSVLPVGNLDLLLSVLGSSPALSKALPVTSFISLFNVLTTSPAILGTMNPIHLGDVLQTIAACPSILNSIPSNLLSRLIDSIVVYLPSCFNCIPADAFETLVMHTNN